MSASTDSVKIAVIGAGRVGTTLALAAYKNGYRVSAIAGRNTANVDRAAKLTHARACSIFEAPNGADIVLLTVADDAIEAICTEMSQEKSFSQGQVVAHCSGVLTSDVLRTAQESCGARIASAHPMQSFSTSDSALNAMPGTYWFCEGETEALLLLSQFITMIGGIPNEISAEKKTLYHSASVIGSNYLVGIIDAALRAAELAGLERHLAWQALSPIVKKTVDNVDILGTVGALTGPIARGDLNTVRMHLAALDKSDPELAKAYRAMGDWTLKVAVKKGLSKQAAEAIKESLEMSKSFD